MSGDMNTALGNCTLMVLMVQAAMRRWKKWDILDDGDDCLLIVEECIFNEVVAALPAIFLSYGQELKVENVARDIRDVVFCQSRVVMTPAGPLFTRNWRKVLSQAACGVNYWGIPKFVRPMLTAVGMCELVLSKGVPILQEFALALIRNGRGEFPHCEDMMDAGLVRRARYECGSADIKVMAQVKAAQI
jgi:hypothetical protein